MAKRPELLIVNGELAGRRFAIKAGCLRLGRSSSNDIQIPDVELSRNHCLFETFGEAGVRLADLASANGTFLNGKRLTDGDVELHEGDVIVVGTTTIRLIGDEPPTPKPTPAADTSGAPTDIKVDLGLGGTTDAPAEPKEPAKRRSPLANVLWVVAVLALAAAIFVVLQGRFNTAEPQPATLPVEEATPVLREVYYEKIEADSRGIFRYNMSVTADGVLRVTIDDVPEEDRHVVKAQTLAEPAMANLREIFDWKTLRTIDREYIGIEPDPPALKSWTIKAVFDTHVRTIRVVNTAEPEVFRMIRERLEAFSKNELGIWAIQYSREKLVQLARECVELGRTKWEDRDIHRGNLSAAIRAFREAGFYLETVNPKPDCAEEAKQGLAQAVAELDRRYADQRFLADRAINLSQWADAQRELGALLELVPERSDERNREATAKLLDVEKRLKGAQ